MKGVRRETGSRSAAGVVTERGCGWSGACSIGAIGVIRGAAGRKTDVSAAVDTDSDPLAPGREGAANGIA